MMMTYMSAVTGAPGGIGKCHSNVGYAFVSRLTPAYLFVLGLVEVSMRYLHNRSVFEPKFIDHINCDNYWWRNALYVNSLFPKKEMVSFRCVCVCVFDC